MKYDTATGAGWGIGAAKGITDGRKGYKASLFEGGINVPFLARWPGQIPAGAIDDESLISAVDLLPTFLEIAGAELPKGYEPDGESMLEVLRGHKAAPSRAKPLFWKIGARWPPSESKPNHWAAWVVVHENWKLLLNSDMSHLELYDLGGDPKEEFDLAESKPDIVARMRDLLDDWRAGLPAAPSGNVFSAERGP